MVNSIINILFVGASKGITMGKSYPLNSQLIFGNEVDKIEEPFLRALVMLLAVLLNDSSVWKKEYTSHLLHYFLKKGVSKCIYCQQLYKDYTTYFPNPCSNGVEENWELRGNQSRLFFGRSEYRKHARGHMAVAEKICFQTTLNIMLNGAGR